MNKWYFEPTLQLMCFKNNLREFWHVSGALSMCTACKTQCATPVKSFHCGRALCAPHPCLCASCPWSLFQTTPNHTIAHPRTLQCLPMPLITQWLGFRSEFVYKDLEVMGYIFSFSKSPFSNVIFDTFFTDFKTTLICTFPLNFGSGDEIFNILCRDFHGNHDFTLKKSTVDPFWKFYHPWHCLTFLQNRVLKNSQSLSIWRWNSMNHCFVRASL